MGATFTGFDDPTGLEFRGDKPYDEQTPSHLVMPDGSSVDFTDRPLGNALTRQVFAAWLADTMEQDALPPCERRDDEAPRCDACGERTYYRRGISGAGGVSQWVHADTGQARCADGQGHADRPVDQVRRAS